eukprot:COSAG02_NODE_35635_length_465_cov_1.398907_1_plen_69_part_01
MLDPWGAYWCEVHSTRCEISHIDHSLHATHQGHTTPLAVYLYKGFPVLLEPQNCPQVKETARASEHRID